MNQLYIVVAFVAALARADDEPFSIGLGVLSPSYSQTVGKENVKVNFQQKNDGFSYSVGDPKSGTNTFLQFGSAAARNPAVNPAGYANANPSGYANVNPAGYANVNPAGYANANSAGYANTNPAGYANYNPAGYGNVNPASYGNDNPAGYADVNPAGYGNANPAGPSPYSYSGSSAGFGQPSANAYGSSNFGPVGGSSGFGPVGGSYGFGGSYNGPNSDAPHSYIGGESARKPEQPMQIIPAGFSYHGTDGQSFLNHNDEESPMFMVSEGDKETARGPAQESFEGSSSGEGQKKYLVNGLVGYGPGGPRRSPGSLGVGEFAGPQNGGFFKDHGGHE